MTSNRFGPVGLPGPFWPWSQQPTNSPDSKSHCVACLAVLSHPRSRWRSNCSHRCRRRDFWTAAESLVALRATVLIKTKGTAVAALRLARATGQEHGAALADLARVAMGHPHPDVQRAAAKLLSDLGDLATISELADELTPSVSRDLGLSVRVAEPAHVVWEQRLAPVPSPVMSSDLAERMAALLEDSSDVGELEAVLAYLAVSESADTLAPLRKRAKTVALRKDYSDIPDPWLPGQVARLVLELLREPAPIGGLSVAGDHAIRRVPDRRGDAARGAAVGNPGSRGWLG